MRQRIKILVEVLPVNKDAELRENVANRALLDKKSHNTLVLSVRNTKELLLDVISVVTSS